MARGTSDSAAGIHPSQEWCAGSGSEQEGGIVGEVGLQRCSPSSSQPLLSVQGPPFSFSQLWEVLECRGAVAFCSPEHPNSLSNTEEVIGVKTMSTTSTAIYWAPIHLWFIICSLHLSSVISFNLHEDPIAGPSYRSRSHSGWVVLACQLGLTDFRGQGGGQLCLLTETAWCWQTCFLAICPNSLMIWVVFFVWIWSLSIASELSTFFISDFTFLLLSLGAVKLEIPRFTYKVVLYISEYFHIHKTILTYLELVELLWTALNW